MERLTEMRFPTAGVSTQYGFDRQLPDRTAGGLTGGTTPAGGNVRSFDPVSGRQRGGARSGLSKLIAARVAGREFVIQSLSTTVGVGYNPPGGGAVQLSQSGRVVTLVAVSTGKVYVMNPGDTAWTEATNATANTPPLNFTGVMFAAQNGPRLYFADGTNWCYYDPSTNTVGTWTPSAGSLPTDPGGNTPRLIATWRGRTVLSGLVNDDQNWFMSRIGDPTDFDYSPAFQDSAQAVAGNNAPMGKVGDTVTALVPFSDDVLLFGGARSLYRLRGDPMDGGSLDLVSSSIGVAFGEAWCMDPYGVVWFFSNRCGLYTIDPTGVPVRVSQPIDNLLDAVDTGTNSIRLMWDDRQQGVHVYVTPLEYPQPATHYFFERRSGAWWTDSFADDDHNPLCCAALDGNTAGDRLALVGGWDGYVRVVDPDAADDDGEAIASEVLIGPVLTKDLDEMMLHDLQAVLAEGSGAVGFDILVAPTAESAIDSTPVLSGSWAASRNLTTFVRAAGHAIYVRLRSTVPWAMESIRARVSTQGGVRRRGY